MNTINNIVLCPLTKKPTDETYIMESRRLAQCSREYRDEVARKLVKSILILLNDSVTFSRKIKLLGSLCLTIDNEEEDIPLKFNNTILNKAIVSNAKVLPHRVKKLLKKETSRITQNLHDSILEIVARDVKYSSTLNIMGILCLNIDDTEQDISIKMSNTLKKVPEKDSNIGGIKISMCAVNLNNDNSDISPCTSGPVANKTTTKAMCSQVGQTYSQPVHSTQPRHNFADGLRVMNIPDKTGLETEENNQSLEFLPNQVLRQSSPDSDSYAIPLFMGGKIQESAKCVSILTNTTNMCQNIKMKKETKDAYPVKEEVVDCTSEDIENITRSIFQTI